MEQQQTIPQTALEWCRIHYPDRIYEWNLRKMTEYAKYYYAAHTPVPTDAKNILQKAEDILGKEQFREIVDKHYNQSKEIMKEHPELAIFPVAAAPVLRLTQEEVNNDIAVFEAFEKENANIADTTAYAYRAFNAGLSHARSQSQSVQPTSSVREIADIKIPLDGKWVSIEEFAGGTAKNLPVGNGWPDSDIQLLDKYVKAQTGMSMNGVEYLQQYKLTHSPVADSRITQYREWLTKMKGVAPGYVTAAQQFDIIFADTTGK